MAREQSRRKVPVVSGSSTASPAGSSSHSGRRARVAARTRLDFWFDAVILVGYTVAYSHGFTGLVIHEWLGIGLGIALLLHLTLHWDWVVRTTRRLFSPRPRQADLAGQSRAAVRHDTVRGIRHRDLAGRAPRTRHLCPAKPVLVPAARPHSQGDGRPRPRPRGTALEMDRRGRPPAARVASGEAAAVKFLRQFAAAVVVVAVVVLIGLAWNHLAPTLAGESPAGHAFVVRGQMIKRLPPGVKPSPGGKLPPGAKPPPPGTRGIRLNNGSGIPRLLLGDLLTPVNLVALRNNALLEAVVIAAAVIIDVGYRRLRRARRARTSLPRPGIDDIY